VQVTSIERDEDRLVIDAEEMLFSAFVDVDDPDGGGDAHLVIIDSDTYNVNLRTLHDSFYTAPVGGESIVCIIEAGSKVGSTSTAVPAFVVGDWPDSVDITIRILGRIQGRGGNSGLAGGTAFYTRYAVTVDNDGQIYGGGGGGGFYTSGGVTAVFGYGGGGAGFNPGLGGTTEIGGAGDPGAGSGGGPGQPGVDSSGPGGAAGTAIDGVSFVTFDTVGSIAGPQVN
jgi:hypothetical protein